MREEASITHCFASLLRESTGRECQNKMASVRQRESRIEMQACNAVWGGEQYRPPKAPGLNPVSRHPWTWFCTGWKCTEDKQHRATLEVDFTISLNTKHQTPTSTRAHLGRTGWHEQPLISPPPPPPLFISGVPRETTNCGATCGLQSHAAARLLPGWGNGKCGDNDNIPERARRVCARDPGAASWRAHIPVGKQSKREIKRTERG